MVQVIHMYIDRKIRFLRYLRTLGLWLLIPYLLCLPFIRIGCETTAGVVAKEEIEPRCQTALGYQTDDEKLDELRESICEEFRKTLEMNSAQLKLTFSESQATMNRIEGKIEIPKEIVREVYIRPESHVADQRMARKNQITELRRLEFSNLDSDEIDMRLYKILD